MRSADTNALQFLLAALANIKPEFVQRATAQDAALQALLSPLLAALHARQCGQHGFEAAGGCALLHMGGLLQLAEEGASSAAHQRRPHEVLVALGVRNLEGDELMVSYFSSAVITTATAAQKGLH